MVGTAVAGGLSTFSSFAYGTVVLMSGSAASVVVASAYVFKQLVPRLRRRIAANRLRDDRSVESDCRITGLQVRGLVFGFRRSPPFQSPANTNG